MNYAFLLIVGKMIIPMHHSKLIKSGRFKFNCELVLHTTMWSIDRNILSVKPFSTLKMICFNIKNAITIFF